MRGRLKAEPARTTLRFAQGSHALAWLLCALLAFSSLGPSAQAQAVASPAEISLARQEFVAGVEAARQGTWDSALAHFEYAHPETLFNVAGAQQKLGELVAAAESYRRYLRTPEAKSRAEAERALADILPALGAVELTLEGVSEGDRVLLDGTPVNRAVLSAELPVDPGSHVLTVERENHEVVRKPFEVDPSQRLAVRAVVPETHALVPTPAEAARSAEIPEKAPYTQADTSRRGLKIAVWSGVAIAVAGAVVGAFLLARKNDHEKVEGTLGPSVNVN
jgi:hypothetical protein